MSPPEFTSAAQLPEPFDQTAVERAFERLIERAEGGDEGPVRLIDICKQSPDANRLMRAVFGASPFLTELIVRDADFALRCLARPPADNFQEQLDRLARRLDSNEDFDDAKEQLRIAKSRVALLIALADLGGNWSMEQVTEHLTGFADTVCNSAVAWLLREAASRGKFEIAHQDAPARGCGYVALAMGKHGAHELNYSSDIDLIVLYDSQTAPLAPGVEAATFFVRLTKRLVDMLQDMTSNGYVFRVDLRLRPDPRATQIAIGFEAACIYYENMGQNWERAAMIKARPVAGDLELGAEFLGRMVPYIWRKYLDFAAIADVQSLKRQIHSVKGHGSIAIPGHNLKLGRGGIREIEFFVQTQQLIAGGRNPRLRGQQTLAMLDRLADENWISRTAAKELQEAYRVLRELEHRVQMLNDEQTHCLPETDNQLDVFSRFCGYPDRHSFEAAVHGVLETVQGHYNALFEEAGELAAETGSLVFTGGEDDPETVETLSRMGFTQPSEVSATIRGWHFGRYAATRSAVARERLTEIMPALLRAIADTADPDAAFVAFDRFMAGLPAGVQLFSMLRANAEMLNLIALILGAAPRLAEQLSHRPRVLDAVLDPGFFDHLPDAGETANIVAAAVADHVPFEEQLDLARVVGSELMFQVGVRILSETINAGQAGQAYSNIADALIAQLLDAALSNIRDRHGEIEGGRAVVMAMGKLGGQEMTAASDLDLILIYDHAADAIMSDGRKPLSPQQYYARVTQRLIAALSSQTAEGVLYEVDMRLRPSGNQGPVATSISSFIDYHKDCAWVWEKLAMTRARVVAGDDLLAEALKRAAASALCQPRDAAETWQAIAEMRERIFAEHGSSDVWNLKHARGGMVDCEFIAQGLQIVHAAGAPGILAQNTAQALDQLATAGLIAANDKQILTAANALYHRLLQVLRLCVTGKFDPANVPSGLSRLLANAAQCPDLATTQSLLEDTQTQLAEVFARLVNQLDD